MLKIRPTLVRVVLIATALVLVGTQLVSSVRADASSGWLSQAGPNIQNVTQLPANQSPGISNRDCIQQDYTAVNPTTGAFFGASDCFASSTTGQMGLFGSPVLFANTSLGLQVNPDYPYLIQPIPNQGMTLALSSAPVNGSYLHFYTDISRHLNWNTAGLGGQLLSYTVNAEPDFSLRDKANALLPTNATGTLSYSSNGSWMLVDTPGGSFIRVNMATFDVLPFAPSLNGQGDYSDKRGETAISDDGRYAAVATNDFHYFKVYDLTTCTGTTNNNYSQPLNCQYRDYWPSMTEKLNGFKAIYALRFINDDNISMTAIYDWQSGTSYSAAKFTVTAPGKQAHSLDYLALGDSYISGEGEFNYKADTDDSNNKCHLSPLSYPYLIGADLFNQYNSIACSGAKTKDITSQDIANYNSDSAGRQWPGKSDPSFDEEIYNGFEPGYRTQISFIKQYQPRVVTLSIGGNDIGFSNIVKECVTPKVGDNTCFDSYDARMNLVKRIDTAYAKLQQTYSQILKTDPGVQLYVIGYPQVVTNGDCADNVHLNSTEVDLAQNLIAYLDWTIQQAANSSGARYVDAQNALDGHRLCEASAANVAINGVTAGNDTGPHGINILGNESFHPNVLGHQLLAQSILSHTNNLKQVMPVADPSIPVPKPTDPLALALLGNFPASGNVSPAIVSVGNNLVGSDVIYRGVGTSISVGASYGLRPNTSYQVSLDGPNASIGNFTTDSTGSLSFSYVPANDTPTGYHTVSIQGANMAMQTTEIDTLLYIAASSDDIDGNGVPDSQNSCFMIPDSGIDLDSDGIDDACDPVIGDVPVRGYPAQVHLTGNTILITNP